MTSDPPSASSRRPVEEEAAQLLAMADGLEKYVEWNGGIHDEGCPEDDTCDCSGKPINDAANNACRFIREQVVQQAQEIERLQNLVALGNTGQADSQGPPMPRRENEL